MLVAEISPEYTGESTYVALQALGNIGDRSAVPAILTLMDRAIKQGSSRMKLLYSIEALGKLEIRPWRRRYICILTTGMKTSEAMPPLLWER